MLACPGKMVGVIGWGCSDSLGGSTNDGMVSDAGVPDSAPIWGLDFGADTNELLWTAGLRVESTVMLCGGSSESSVPSTLSLGTVVRSRGPEGAGHDLFPFCALV